MNKLLKYLFNIPFAIGFVSYVRFIYFFYIKKSFKTLYPIESSDFGMAKRNNVTALQGNTEHIESHFGNIIHMIKNKFNGQRSSRLIYPLKSLDYLDFKKQKILSIGPRLESEIFNLVKHGFLKKNISALDLQSYSPLISLGDMLKMPYEDNTFDVIFCGWVLVYTNEIQKAVNEMIRVTKSSGHIAIGISHKPDVKLTNESLSTSNEVLNYFGKNVERVIFNHHPGDLKDRFDKNHFRCIFLIQIKK
tara:strand:+ start:3165 stop:3908 length:744 start_codon:yes stop_codon:yes gene_type:complete